MKTRLLFLIKTYALTVLLFVAAKVVFMLCYGVKDAMFDVICHGLSLDFSTALYFLVVPLVLTAVSVWTKVPRWLWRAYFAIVAVAFALAFVADTSLYEFWGTKLDAQCLQYLEQPEGITASVSFWYLALRAVVTVAAAVGIYLIYDLRINDLRLDSIYHSEIHDSQSLKRRGEETAVYVLLVPVMFIGIRGGFSESTTNVGQVYFSQNQLLNHSAVNPVFNFLYSLSHQIGDASEYTFMDDDECLRLTEKWEMRGERSEVRGESYLRVSKPDIVIILLEGSGEQFASVMPRLQQLKSEGVYFSQCYANSWRTDRGTLSTLSGYPSFPTLSVMKMPEKSATLPSIAKTLRGEGYATHYIYGGDINFTNMRSYLISTGWERLTSMDDFTFAEQHSAEWGVRDDIMFGYLSGVIGSYKELGGVKGSYGEASSAQRRLIGFSTLSSHEPWDVPGEKRNDDEVLNAFGYLDECLSDFVEKLRATPEWDNLLIVITADHGINHGDINRSTPKMMNHIPMLWLGGAVKEPRTVEKLCNQSDLAATLLGQMGIEHGEFTFSRDVLSESYAYPTATNNYNNAQWMIDSTGYVLYDFDAQRIITSEGNDTERLLKVSKAILQRTYEDLKGRN